MHKEDGIWRWQWWQRCGSNAAVVAILGIFVIIVAAALFIFGGQFFGGGGEIKKVDVTVNAPTAAGKAVPRKSRDEAKRRRVSSLVR